MGFKVSLHINKASIVSAIMIVIALALAYVGFQEYKYFDYLLSNGRETTGKVVGVKRSVGIKGRDKSCPMIEFEYSGNIFLFNSKDCQQADVSNIKIGDTVNVLVDPANPDRSETIAEASARKSGHKSLFYIAGFLVLLGILIFIVSRLN